MNPEKPAPKTPAPSPPQADSKDEKKPTKALTPEEQMAQYEESLKESDWGHQPC